MRAYYYLLFRIYTQLMKPKNENSERSALIITTVHSMLLLIFCLITILFYLNYYQFLDVEIPNKSFMIFFMIILGLINYVFFIKDKKFMNYNFKTDKTGGYTIIGFIVLLALSFAFIANKNREKIFKERERARIENQQ